MTKANECTCPSGDGSLRHPCPAHPASVELAGVGAKLTFINGRPAMCGCQVEYSSGGGEYSDVIDVTLCAKHSGSAILDLVATNRIALTPEYEGQWHADLYLDREIPLAKAEGATPAEAVLALMSAERIDPEQGGVDQAGGDRWDALQSIMEWTAAENIPDDRKLCLIRNAARAALAQPSPVRSSLLINGYQLRAALEFIAPDGTAKQLESEARIEWRQQDSDFLEAGLYAWCAEYPEEGCVLLDEEPTTSQPSPAPELAERGTQHRFSTTEQTCQHDFAGVWWNDNGETKTGRECRHCGFFVADVIKAQAEQAEAERPEVVGYRSATSRMVYEKDYGLQKPEPMMLVAFTACINELDADNARLHEVATACATAEQERDAALDRVAELESKLAELEKQDLVDVPGPDEIHQMAFEEGQPADDGDGYLFSAEEFDLFVQRLLDSCAAPVAQPEETPGEMLAAKLIETWVAKHGKPAPWSKIVEITALATNMPNDERDRLLALDDDVDAQAQHSVPEGWKLVPSDKGCVTSSMKAECIGEFSFYIRAACAECLDVGTDSDCHVCGGDIEYDQKIDVPWDTCKEIYKAMLAAAPGKEGV